METKIETIEAKDTQTKNTKDRLDELKELYKNGYVTENEFSVARVNILKDGGVDVVTRHEQLINRPDLPEEEEELEQKGGGCGCFLLTLLLAALILLVISFFAAPYWPERFGGTGVRAAREWFTAKVTDLLDGYSESSTEGIPVPVPIPSGSELPEADSSDVAETESEISDAQNAPATGPGQDADSIAVPLPPSVNQALPSLDMTIFSPSLNPAGQAADSPAAPAGAPAENPVRGRISARRARIRSAPDTSTNDNVVGWGRSGDRFIVLEEGVGRDSAKWYNIAYESGDKRGWVSGSLVRLEAQGN